MIPDNERIEEGLRETFRREAAPPDFAAKVLARTALEEKAVTSAKVVEMRPKSWLRRPFALGIAAAVGLAIIPVAVLDYQRREEARGMKAKQDLLTALAITRVQLQQAKSKVQRATKSIQ